MATTPPGQALAPGISELAPVLGLAPQQVLELLGERRSDLQRRFRTGTLGEMFAKAVEIEPLIGQARRELTQPRMIPFTRRIVTNQIGAVHSAQEAAGFRRARLVVVVSPARRRGRPRMEEHIVEAVAAHVDPDEIVVVYTSTSARGRVDQFPSGVREIEFGRIVDTLEPEDARTALVVLLRSFHGDAIVNVGSRMFYDSLTTYGRALAASERIFLCFLGTGETATRARDDWSMRYFYRTFDEVAGVITDDEDLARELAETYRMTGKAREKLHVFGPPLDPELPSVVRPGGGPLGESAASDGSARHLAELLLLRDRGVDSR